MNMNDNALRTTLEDGCGCVLGGEVVSSYPSENLHPKPYHLSTKSGEFQRRDRNTREFFPFAP